MSTKNKTEASDTSVKHSLSSASASSISGQTSNGLARQKPNVRATSAKYYDIASTILGGSGDVEELFLNAAKNGNLNKLEQLLQQRSDVNLDVDCKDKRTGNTALIWAAKRGHSKIVELLLRYGCDATLCNYEAQTALETAFSPVRTLLLDWVETKTDFSEKLLLQAAWMGNLSVIHKILDSKRNIDVNCQNAEGLTPLMLVSRDVQLFERLSTQLNRYYSPVQVAEELMRAKANIHVTDNDGRSSLHYASQSRASCADGLISALVSGGSDIELRDKRLFTPLHLASQLGNTNNVTALADGGSDVNVKGFAGLTPLHMTAYNDHHKTAVTLLTYGADVTVTDERGLTAVDLAKTRRMKITLKEAWAEATKGNNSEVEHPGLPDRNDAGNSGKKKRVTTQKKRPEVIFDDVINNSTKPPAPSSSSTKYSSSSSKVLSNVEKCKQAERKILQEVETFKATHPVLQRESTRMLGTSRSKVLPQIGRSSSPETPSTPGNTGRDSNRSPSRGSVDLQKSMEDVRMQLVSRGRSVSDIKLGVGRQSEVLSSAFLDDDSSADCLSSRLGRTTPLSRDGNITGRSLRLRSGSDPATPSLRDLAVSCDNILPYAREKTMMWPMRRRQSPSRDSPTPHGANNRRRNSGDLKAEEDLLRSMESPFELLRCRSLLKEEFILAESRPKEMASGSDPASSFSSSSLSSSSPRDPSHIQQSPVRSLKHDPSLTTLMEQQPTTEFSKVGTDTFSNVNGKPVIKNPQQRVRRRSENALCSSQESDTEVDLKSSLIRTHSLRKFKENSDLIKNTKSSALKSHSMENVSPRASVESSVIFQNTFTAKSHSESNLDTPRKKNVSHSKSSDSTQDNTHQRSKTQSKSSANLSANSSNKVPLSKKWAVEPFSGKAKLVSSSKFDSWDPTNNQSVRKDHSNEKFAFTKTNAASPVKSDQEPASSNSGQSTKISSNILMKSCSGTLQQNKSNKNSANQQRPHTVAENRPVGEENEQEDNTGKKSVKPGDIVTSQSTSQLSSQATVSPAKLLRSNTVAQSNPSSKCVNNNLSSQSLKTSNQSGMNNSAGSPGHITKPPDGSRTSADIVGRQFVVTEESAKRAISSAGKQGSEAQSQSKSSEKADAKAVHKQTSGKVPDDPKNKSVNKAACIEKNIIRNQKVTMNAASAKNKPESKVSFKPTVSGKSGYTESIASNTNAVSKDSNNIVPKPAENTNKPGQKNVTGIRKPTASTTVSSKTDSKLNSTAQTTSASPMKTPQKSEASKSTEVISVPKKKDESPPTTDANKKVSTPTDISHDITQPSGQIEPLVKIKFQQSAVTTPTSTAPSPVVKTSTANCSPKNTEIISTPIIVNPFEEFLQAHIKVIENTQTDAVVKMKKTVPNKSQKKKIVNSTNKRPNSGSSRQTSAGKKKGGKGKDTKTEKDSRPKSGKKSGKGSRDKKGNEEEKTETEVTAAATKPDTAIISGIGWQLSAACNDISNFCASKDIHFESSDSDISYDSDKDVTICNDEVMESKMEPLNKHLLEALKEKITENSPRFLELKRRENSLLNMKLPVAENDGFPPMNLDMTQNPHTDYDGNRYVMEGEDYLRELTISETQDNHDIQREIFLGKLTPIPEVSFLSRTTNAISNFDKNFKGSKLSLLLDGATLDNETTPRAGDSKNVPVENKPTSVKQKDRDDQRRKNKTKNEPDERQTVLNYEYTPTGKIIRRTQSLKEFQGTDRWKHEFKFSESQNHMKEKAGNEEEDIDEVIDEILSSTTSSMASTLRNWNQSAGNLHPSGVQTLTEGDRKLLMQMTSSKFNSPFHANISDTPVSQVEPGAGSSEKVDKNKVGSSDLPKKGEASQLSDIRKSQESSQSQRCDHVSPVRNSQNCPSSHVSSSSKPPLSSRSSIKEERAARKVPVGRSMSTREHRRSRGGNDKLDHTVTDEEAKQLAKVINSFRHMELHASTHRVETLGGSAKSPTRNSKNLLGITDLTASILRPSSVGASLRSKGKFQELKDTVTPKPSKEIKDSHGAESQTDKLKTPDLHFENECLLDQISSAAELAVALGAGEEVKINLDTRRGSFAASECTIYSSKSGEDDTIQWKKGNVLGRGAFGTVWCGLTNEGQLIAVKQIELTAMDKTKTQHEYEKVQEEVELLKTLNHVNIVGYLGTSLEDNIVSIFMQFIPGGSIASILARFGALDESVFKRYTKQILEGVKYLHANDVIHRDLKGANVMLMPNGVIKLIDFGCAKRLCINLSISQTEILKSMKGTPFWMAPEVVNETGHGKKSDIWSIGCTVFEMATRKPPWSDMNPMAAIFAIGSLSRPVPTLDHKFSQEARDFVGQCLIRDQETRPCASELLDHPFIARRNGGKQSSSSEV